MHALHMHAEVPLPDKVPLLVRVGGIGCVVVVVCDTTGQQRCEAVHSLEREELVPYPPAPVGFFRSRACVRRLFVPMVASDDG